MKTIILEKQKRKVGFPDSIILLFWLKPLTFHVEVAVKIGWSWAIEDSDSSITKLFICINVNIHFFFTVQKLKGEEEIQAMWVLLVTGGLEQITKAREVTCSEGAKLDITPFTKKQYSKTRGLTSYPLMPTARVSTAKTFHTRKENDIR